MVLKTIGPADGEVEEEIESGRERGGKRIENNSINIAPNNGFICIRIRREYFQHVFLSGRILWAANKFRPLQWRVSPSHRLRIELYRE